MRANGREAMTKTRGVPRKLAVPRSPSKPRAPGRKASPRQTNVDVTNSSRVEGAKLGCASRNHGFTASFVSGMNRDTSLQAATRATWLAETRLQRKRETFEAQILRYEDFHTRMLKEISLLRKQEERKSLREARRVQFRRERDSAVRIQAVLRGKLVRRQNEAIRAAASRRRRSSLLRMDQRRREDAACIPLQGACRGWLSRRRARARQEASITLQRFWRRRKLKNHKAELAVVQLQALYRGRLIRSLLQDDDDDDDEDINDDDMDDDDTNEMDNENVAEDGKVEKEDEKKNGVTSSQGDIIAGRAAAACDREDIVADAIDEPLAAKTLSSFTAKSGGARATEQPERSEGALSSVAIAASEEKLAASARKQARSKRRGKRRRYHNTTVSEARKVRKRRNKAALNMQKTYRGYRSRQQTNTKKRSRVSL